jgi:hypothetical protein
MNALVRNLLLVLLAVGAIAAAGDQAASTPAGQGEPAPAEPTTPTPTATPTPVATPTPGFEEQLEEFVPSEEIRADQAVAFPVDI